MRSENSRGSEQQAIRLRVKRDDTSYFTMEIQKTHPINIINSMASAFGTPWTWPVVSCCPMEVTWPQPLRGHDGHPVTLMVLPANSRPCKVRHALSARTCGPEASRRSLLTHVLSTASCATRPCATQLQCSAAAWKSSQPAIFVRKRHQLRNSRTNYSHYMCKLTSKYFQ